MPRSTIGLLGLAGGLPEGTFLRFAAEIARNVNDPENLRVLPVVTQGATDNVKDLLYLKGIDIAITNADVLEHFKTIEKIPNIEKRINFVSEMVISEVHVVVRPEINSFKDLEGKKVSFHTAGAGSSTTAPIIFKRLGVNVEPVYINNAIALEKMKTGEIVGLVNNGAKPQDLLTKFKNDQGFKFLPIPFDRFDEYYIPATLTSEDYPGFIKPGEKVETLGVQTVLAVYNWPRESDRYPPRAALHRNLLRPLREPAQAALSPEVEEREPRCQRAGMDAVRRGGRAPKANCERQVATPALDRSAACASAGGACRTHGCSAAGAAVPAVPGMEQEAG